MTELRKITYTIEVCCETILFYFMLLIFFFCVEMFMNILCFSGAFARAKRAQRSPIAIENGNNRLQKI